MTSFNLSYFLKALSSNIITLGVRTSIYRFWGGRENSSVHRAEITNQEIN